MAVAVAAAAPVKPVAAQPALTPGVSPSAKLFRTKSTKQSQPEARRPSTASASFSASSEAGPSSGGVAAKLGLGRWRSRTSSTASSSAAGHDGPLSLSRTTSELASMLPRRGSTTGGSSSSAATHAEDAKDKAGRLSRKTSIKKAAPSAWARYLRRGSSQSGQHGLLPSTSAPTDVRHSSSSSSSAHTESRQAKSTTETMEIMDQDEPIFSVAKDGAHQDGLGRSHNALSSSGDVGYIDYSRRSRALSLDALEEANAVSSQQGGRHEHHRLERHTQSASGHTNDRSPRPATSSAAFPDTSLTRSTSERLRASNADRLSERGSKRPLYPPPSGGRRRRTSSTRSSEDERAARIRANLALAGSGVAGVPSPPSSVRSGSTHSSMSGHSPGTFGPQTRYNDDDAGGSSLGHRSSDVTRPFPSSTSIDSTAAHSASGHHAALAGTPPRPSKPHRQPTQSRAELIRRQIMETQSDTGHNRRSAPRPGSRNGGGGSGETGSKSALLHARRSSQGAERILESTRAATAGGLSPNTAAWEASAANAPPVSPSGWYNAAHGAGSHGRPSSADSYASTKSITDLRREAANHWGGRAADPTLIKMALASASPNVGAGGSFSSRISLASSGGHGGGGRAQSLTSFQSGEGERQPVLPPRFGSMEGPAVPRTHERTSSLVRFVSPANAEQKRPHTALPEMKEVRGNQGRAGAKGSKKLRDKALPPRPARAGGALSGPTSAKLAREPSLRVPVRYEGARESGSSGQSSTDEGSRESTAEPVLKVNVSRVGLVGKSAVSSTPHVLAYTTTSARQAAMANDGKDAVKGKSTGAKAKIGEADGAEQGKRRRGLRFLSWMIN